MAILRLVLVALACGLLPAASAGAALPKGDLVFILDESGSMGNEIADVRAQVNAIAAAASQRLDARYALVGFGGASPGVPPSEPFTRTDFTTAAGLRQALEGSGAYSGVGGGREIGLAATTYALTALAGFRADASACAILISDESPDFRVDEATDLGDASAAVRGRGTTWFGVVNTTDEVVRRTYGPDPGSLAAISGGAMHALSAFRRDPSEILAAVIARCARAVEQAELPQPGGGTATGGSDTGTGGAGGGGTGATGPDGECTISGTPGRDVLRGTPGPDVICGFGGDDLIVGGGGDDVLDGGAGNDRLRGLSGRDRLVGGPGRDVLSGGARADVLRGERGGDRLYGGRGRDRLRGLRGRDVLRGNAGADRVWASDGRRDHVDGGAGADTAAIDAGLDRVRAVERVR